MTTTDSAIRAKLLPIVLVKTLVPWWPATTPTTTATTCRTPVMSACSITIPLRPCVFRQSNPAVVGVRVIAGKLQAGVNLVLPSGKRIGKIKQMKMGQENISEANQGAEVAISIEGPTVGRQINVGDDLYVEIPEHHVKILEGEMTSHLTGDMNEILDEYTRIRRKERPFWGK